MLYSTNLLSKGLRNQSYNQNEVILLDEFDQIMIDSEKEFRVLMNKTYNKPELELKKTEVNDYRATILFCLKDFEEAINKLAQLYFKIDYTTKYITSRSQFKDIDKLKYDKPYYLYKNLDLEKSFTSFSILINKEISELKKAINEVNRTEDNNALAVITQANINELDNIDKAIDNIRGSILGLPHPVSKEEFGRELFNYFREEDIELTNNELNRTRIEEAIDSYFDKSKHINSLSRLSSKFTKDTLNAVKDLEDIKIYKTEYPEVLKSICMVRSFRIKAICDIYKALFASKLNAIDEYNKLNKDILLSILDIKELGLDVNKESYLIQYDNLQATLEFYDSMIDIYSNIVLYEANNGIVRNEFVVNSLKNYVLKVNRSVESAWKKFNDRINNPKYKAYLEKLSNSNKIPNFRRTFTLKKIRVYSLGVLDTIKINNFDYESNKDKYKSKDDYYKATYNNLFSVNPKSIRKAINKKTITINNFNVNPQSVAEIFNFVTKDIYEYASEIENNIKSLSNSTVTIGNKVNNESVEADAYDIFNEALASSPNSPIKASVKVKNNIKGTKPQIADDNPDKISRIKGASYSKAVQIYLKISCDILTAKMDILYKAYHDYMAILANTFK